jgi:hypothetical protein
MKWSGNQKPFQPADSTYEARSTSSDQAWLFDAHNENFTGRRYVM